MPAALRIQSVTLSVGDLEAAERLYRWSFRLEPVGLQEDGVRTLGWGSGEDRLRLVDAARMPEPAEALGLRMRAAPVREALAWARDAGLRPLQLRAAAPQVEAAGRLAPDLPVEELADPAHANVFVVVVEGPGRTRFELVFPLPPEELASGATPRFAWRSTDWSGLETPGLLGVTLGLPEPDEARASLSRLGAVPLEGDDPRGPLRVGDQQVLVEERSAAGIYGLALLVPLAKLAEARRTLEHLKVELRESGNRLLTRDPTGRIVIVQGVRAA